MLVKYRRGPLLVAAVALAAAGCYVDDGLPPGSSGSEGGSGGGIDMDPSDYLTAPMSCAYMCPNEDCAEQTAPYVCPALADWTQLPHVDACPTWDGTYPTPAAGQCVASAPTGAALVRTGDVSGMPGVRVLPDGRAIKPAGSEWPFDETQQAGGSTSGIAAVPGTSFVFTVDTGDDDHAVRVVDTTRIGQGDPVTGFIDYAPGYLNDGIAALASGRVYVATGQGVVQAFDVDLKTGALARNDAASVMLPISQATGLPWYSSGVAASPDGTRLVVSGVFDSQVFVYDIDPTSATYLKQLGVVDIGVHETFGAWFDPHDPTGASVYVSVWGGYKVVEIDVSTPAKPTVAHAYATDKNPEGVAFLDARWMVVANDFGETMLVVDCTTGTVTSVPVEFDPGYHGVDVSGVAWDATNQRLYTTLSGVNALAAYAVDLTATPPTLTPAGRLPTSWWPTGVVVAADGSLTVSNLRGHPIGPFPVMDGGDGHALMKGSVEQIPSPTTADLHRRAGAGGHLDRRRRAGGLPGRHLSGRRRGLPGALHQHRGSLAGHQAHLLHRAGEQDVRLALRGPARGQRRRQHHDEGDHRRDGPGSGPTAASWPAPSPSPTTTTPRPCSRRRAIAGPRTAAPPTSASAPGATTCARSPSAGSRTWGGRWRARSSSGSSTTTSFTASSGRSWGRR